MKNNSSRLLKLAHLKCEDLAPNDSNDWMILRLNSKVTDREIKYSDLLERINFFISTLSKNIEKVLDPFDLKDQEKLLTEISYFSQKKSESIYTQSLLEELGSELMDRLYDLDFTKEKYQKIIKNLISEFSNGAGLNKSFHSRRKSQEDIRSITPIKSNRKSVSPCDKSPVNYQKEYTELKKNYSEVIKERDVLKAWKDNSIKNPNFDYSAEKIIKGLKEENDLISVKNSCLQSKIGHLVSCVSMFISNTSRFQKAVREREGFTSQNYYDTEKHRIEVKLKEITEASDLTWDPLKRMIKSHSKSGDFTKPELKLQLKEKFQAADRLNSKLIDEISKQYSVKIESQNNLILKLESENRSLKNKALIASKELKQSKALEEIKNSENSLRLLHRFSIEVKKKLKDLFRDFLEKLENRMQRILNKITEKNFKVKGLKDSFIKVLKGNLFELIKINEEQESSNEYKDEIEHLNFAIEQSQIITENQIKTLENKLALLESENFHLVSQSKSSQEKIQFFQRENLEIPALKKHLELSQQSIKSLESAVAEYKELNKTLLSEKSALQHTRFERDLFESQNIKLTESYLEASKKLQDSQEKLREFELKTHGIIESLHREIKKTSDKNYELLLKLAKISVDKETMTEHSRLNTEKNEWSDSLTENSPFIEDHFQEDLINVLSTQQDLNFEKQILIEMLKNKPDLHLSTTSCLSIASSQSLSDYKKQWVLANLKQELLETEIKSLRKSYKSLLSQMRVSNNYI